MIDVRRKELEAQARLCLEVFSELAAELRRDGCEPETIWIGMLSIACDYAGTFGADREKVRAMVESYFNAVDEREAKKRRTAS